jgi:hypothetical protein
VKKHPLPPVCEKRIESKPWQEHWRSREICWGKKKSLRFWPGNGFSLIPTESIVRDHQQEYYQALEESGRNGDSTAFIEFMLKTIVDAVKSSVKSSVKTEDRVFRYFKENPNGTVGALAESLGRTLRAVEKQISALKAQGRLKRTGTPRKGRWVAEE